jgi:hypothetical protein
VATSQNEATHKTKYVEMGLVMRTLAKGANAINQ